MARWRSDIFSDLGYLSVGDQHISSFKGAFCDSDHSTSPDQQVSATGLCLTLPEDQQQANNK
jgi:hypothetical protein